MWLELQVTPGKISNPVHYHRYHGLCARLCEVCCTTGSWAEPVKTDSHSPNHHWCYGTETGDTGPWEISLGGTGIDYSEWRNKGCVFAISLVSTQIMESSKNSWSVAQTQSVSLWLASLLMRYLLRLHLINKLMWINGVYVFVYMCIFCSRTCWIPQLGHKLNLTHYTPKYFNLMSEGKD